MKQRARNLGKVALISQTNFWQRFWEFIAQINQFQDIHFHFVGTVDEAYEIVYADV